MMVEPSTKREGRSERTEWLKTLGTLPTAYADNPEPMQLLKEARACYAEGLMMATVLASAAHVEHTLAQELELRGLKAPGAHMSFADAITAARKIFKHEIVCDNMDRLRLVRNPLAHRKPDGHKHSIHTRLRDENRHPDLILQDDAKLALYVMHGLFFATLRQME